VTVDQNFDAHHAVSEAHERHEAVSEHRGSRFVPVAAAVLAVTAALANLLSNQRATEALSAKNEAILARAEASDDYAYYQARKTRATIYETALATTPAMPAAERDRLRAAATHERSETAPLLAQAKKDEARIAVEAHRSESAMRAHEVLEGSVTLFEVSIAVVSISALAASGLLTGLGLAAAGVGLVVLVIGLLTR